MGQIETRITGDILNTSMKQIYDALLSQFSAEQIRMKSENEAIVKTELAYLNIYQYKNTGSGMDYIVGGFIYSALDQVEEKIKPIIDTLKKNKIAFNFQFSLEDDGTEELEVRNP
jgi:hypothetical protein